MSLVRFWWHGDIVALQQQLDADLEGTNNTVTGCTKLSDAMRASWQSFYASAKSFTQADASYVNTGTQADQGQALQRELYAWQQKIAGFCSLTVPSVDPDKLGNDSTAMLKWLGIGAGALAVAYVTAQIAATVRVFAPHSKE